MLRKALARILVFVLAGSLAADAVTAGEMASFSQPPSHLSFVTHRSFNDEALIAALSWTHRQPLDDSGTRGYAYHRLAAMAAVLHPHLGKSLGWAGTTLAITGSVAAMMAHSPHRRIWIRRNKHPTDAERIDRTILQAQTALERRDFDKAGQLMAFAFDMFCDKQSAPHLSKESTVFFKTFQNIIVELNHLNEFEDALNVLRWWRELIEWPGAPYFLRTRSSAFMLKAYALIILAMAEAHPIRPSPALLKEAMAFFNDHKTESRMLEEATYLLMSLKVVTHNLDLTSPKDDYDRSFAETHAFYENLLHDAQTDPAAELIIKETWEADPLRESSNGRTLAQGGMHWMVWLAVTVLGGLTAMHFFSAPNARHVLTAGIGLAAVPLRERTAA